jgi:hypothetical protein
MIRTTPLAFELVCKGTVLKTLGDAVRVCGELTPEQREEDCWRVAIHTLNNAVKEPQYIKAATITLQTALNLSGLLAQPPSFSKLRPFLGLVQPVFHFFPGAPYLVLVLIVAWLESRRTDGGGPNAMLPLTSWAPRVSMNRTSPILVVCK